MPPRKLPKTFDEHLGSVIDGLARFKGGRSFLVGLLDWSAGTVERRVTGRTQFTAKEIFLIAEALNTRVEEIASRTLRNYAGGSEQDGIDKLIREEGPVSEAPVSLDDHRQRRKPSEMTEEEMEGVPNAAGTDPELGYDEPEQP